MNKKIKDTAKRCAPVVVGIGIGVVTLLLVGYKKPIWERCNITPDQLKSMIDEPQIMMSYPSVKMMLVNTSNKNWEF